MILALLFVVITHFPLNYNPKCLAGCSCPGDYVTLYTTEGCTRALQRKLHRECADACKIRTIIPKRIES